MWEEDFPFQYASEGFNLSVRPWSVRLCMDFDSPVSSSEVIITDGHNMLLFDFKQTAE